MALTPIRTDTLIPTPDTTLRKLVIAAEQSKVLKNEVKILEGQIDILNKLVVQYDSRDSVQKTFYQGQITNLQNQVNLYKDQIKGYEKLLKKERRRRRLATFGGILTTGVMAYLFIMK